MCARENEKIRYDNEHDVLYIFLGAPRLAYDDEISPGIFLRKTDDTDEVVGAVIMDYRKCDTKHLRRIIPFDIDFMQVNSQFLH